MKCSRCQYELSQCLDGRLGSGRRAVVMRHVEACDACAGFWDELQKAQELVLGVPPVRVTPGFRAQLWERIRSGEGTPEAVFREPVPIVTKVRYVLSGAAAAAAVLVALYVASPPEGRVADDIARGGRPVTVADTRTEGRLAPSPASDALIPVQFSPQVLADTAALNLQSSYVDLSDRVRRLNDAPDQDLDYKVRQICEVALETKGFGQLLADLETQNFVQFSPPVSKELRFFNAFLDETDLRRQPTVEVVRLRIVPGLEQARNLARVKTEMTVLVGDRQRAEAQRFVHRMAELARLYPESFRHLRLYIPQSGVMSCDPVVPEFQAPSGVFLFQSGPTWQTLSSGTFQQHGVRVHVMMRSNQLELLETESGSAPSGLYVLRMRGDIRAEREEVEVRRQR